MSKITPTTERVAMVWYASGGGHISGPHQTEREAREHMRQIVETDKEFNRRLFDWAQRERERIQWSIAKWVVDHIGEAVDDGVRSITIRLDGDPEPRPVRRASEFPADLKVWSERVVDRIDTSTTRS